MPKTGNFFICSPRFHKKIIATQNQVICILVYLWLNLIYINLLTFQLKNHFRMNTFMHSFACNFISITKYKMQSNKMYIKAIKLLSKRFDLPTKNRRNLLLINGSTIWIWQICLFLLCTGFVSPKLLFMRFTLIFIQKRSCFRTFFTISGTFRGVG